MATPSHLCLTTFAIAALTCAVGSGNARPAQAAAPGAAAAPKAAAPDAATAPKAAAPDTKTTEETTAETAPAAQPGPMALPDELPDPARIVVAKLHEEVSLGMAAFVDRQIDTLGPGDILMLDINTFGGRVDAAVAIRDAVLSVRQRQAVTVAYIHPRAISAGALIAFATDVIIVAPGATMGAAMPVTMQGGKMEATDEKVVSYMRQEMRATAEARGRDGDIAEAMVDAAHEIPGLSEAGKLLTLDGKQALAYGIASAEAATMEDAIFALGYGEGQRAHSRMDAEWSWAEIVASIITGATLSGLLMSVGMLGLMIGMYTGGSPVPLAIGIGCLMLFFLGHHIVDLAGLEEFLLFALGAALLAVEIFMPGHILPGVLGLICIVASLVLGLLRFDQVPLVVQWEAGWVTRAVAVVFGSIAFTAVLAFASFRALPETRLGKRLLLETTVSGHAAQQSVATHRGLIGSRGVALTDLRPAGHVRIAGKRLDAVAERGFIAAGSDVIARKSRGFSLVVTKAKAKAENIAERQAGEEDAV